MARFNIEEAKNYGGGGSAFFGLADDKDTARVRFLINNINDLYGVSCHEIDVGGKKVDVECLRAYNEPVDNCPLCRANYGIAARLFIPLYDETDGKSKIWTRGKTYFDKMASLCSRYNPLVGTSFDIERIGKRGDQATRYETYPIETDNARISDFPEVNPEGTAFQVRTYEELEEYLRSGSFSEEKTARPTNHQAPTRQVPIRRTPTRNVEEDKF